jgi:hypothetical protein
MEISIENQLSLSMFDENQQGWQWYQSTGLPLSCGHKEQYKKSDNPPTCERHRTTLQQLVLVFRCYLKR